jgi:L-aminopeptidase/D-esterase-like protein
MNELLPPPPGFRIGHATIRDGGSGCTVVIAPAGSTGGVDVRGGGPGTRETDSLGPYATTNQVTAVVLTGGSAFGLAAADGAVRWLSEQGMGYPTPAGPVPVVPAAVVYDLSGAGDAHPGPDDGYAACVAAREGVPDTGRLGAGTGVSVGKLFGPGRSTLSGIGYAAERTGRGETVAALAVANAFGDVVAEDGSLIGAPSRPDGELIRSRDVIASLQSPPDWTRLEPMNTTLVCVMTDAALDKLACARVARMASAGIARAVDPVYSDVDGDTVFCVSSGTGRQDFFAAIQIGTLAATLTAAAIRDAVSEVGSGTA